MSVIGSNILAGSSSVVDSYDIDNSLRFNSADSAYLSKTFAGAGNRTSWTISLWFKLGNIQGGTTGQRWLSAGDDPSYGDLKLYGGQVYFNPSSSGASLVSTRKFRDPSAWYHLVGVYDSDNATSDDRIRLYVNGERETAFGTATYPAQGTDSSHINTAILHRISTYNGTAEPIDGYLAEYYFVDGQSLAADSFGELSSTTNQWIPKEAVDDLTFGTNGFYLKFQDSSALGDDSSGNNNDFAVNVITATDQMLDTPTNNFCTFNSILGYGTGELIEGSLILDSDTSPDYTKFAAGTFGATSGKWYLEYYIFNKTHNGVVGVRDDVGLWDAHSGDPPGYCHYAPESGGYIYRDGLSTITTVGTFIAGDIIGCAVNMDDGECQFFKNGAVLAGSGNVPVAMPASTQNGFVAYSKAYNVDKYGVNFGQDSSFAGTVTAQGNQDDNGKGDFYYAPPSGFLALCTDNLSAPEIKLPGENFNTVIWSGNDADDREITGVGFQPDLIWNKRRSAIGQHQLQDSLRGVTKVLKSSSTTSEGTETNSTKSFDSDGFTVGTDGNINGSGTTYVAWNWKAGGAPTADNSAGAGATPTAGSVKIDGSNLGSALAGSIAATKISANTTSGFSIVQYEGTEAVATVAHGLSQAPELILFKNIDSSLFWPVYNKTIDATDYLQLNADTARADSDGYFNDAEPTASVFSLGDKTNLNRDTCIAYCFHSVESYSKVGSYTGNGNADGPFLYCGFQVKYAMCKRIDDSQSWLIFDDARNTYNQMDKTLRADTTAIEQSIYYMDMVSNGIKIREGSSIFNHSGGTYIFLAFASHPFKTSNAR